MGWGWGGVEKNHIYLKNYRQKEVHVDAPFEILNIR